MAHGLLDYPRWDPVDRVQPDSMLWKTFGSTAEVGTDSYLHGAPELAAEAAASSASYDLHSKKDSYLRAGVSEYVVWVTETPAIHWFARVGDRFEELTPGPDGWTESRVFPGLRLHIQRLLDGDRTVVLPGAS
jgi:Uma2 family endonuclease